MSAVTHVATGITAVGTTPNIGVPIANTYLLQVNLAGTVTTTQVSPELSIDGVNWWTPSGLSNLSASPGSVVYQMINMPSLQMRLNVTAIDAGVTISAWVADV